MIKTVYLDLDGVITDFVKGVCMTFHRPNPYPTLTQDYTFWNAWPEISTKTVNDVCDMGFWHTLNWTSDGCDILRTILNHFKPEQIYLLTTPMPNPGSYTGKALWVQSHLPEYSKRLIVTSAPKSLFAKPDTLLIDDKDGNVEEFAEAEGYGILVNRLWNKGNERADHTVEDLEIDLLDIVHDVGVDQ